MTYEEQKAKRMPESTRIALLTNPSRQFTRGILSGIAEYARLHGLWNTVAARRNIACWRSSRSSNRTAFLCASRRNSFCEKVAQAGFRAHVYRPTDMPSERTWEQELPRIIDWLRGLPKPVGIMTCNDDRGELVIEACKMERLSVPDEVAVVGVDNDTLICDLCSPPLSSVATNLERIGYESAETLDHMIAGRENGRPTLWIRPTHVAARQSTDVLAKATGISPTEYRQQHQRGR